MLTHRLAPAPHNYNSTTLGLAATLPAAAGMANFIITEYFVNYEDVAAEIAHTPFQVENSYITLPTEPGLGIDLDENALARRPYREHTLRWLRHPHEE